MAKLLLEAFKGKNSRVPVWLMRQAGRYLPEYQAVKKQSTLRDMFRNPDVSAEITLQPVRILGVDAAILFADILTLPGGMGFDIDFVDGRGPVVANPISSAADAARVGDFAGLDHVAKTVRLVKKGLSDEIALIGFAGSPFTVLTYLMQDRHGSGINKALRFAYADEKAYHAVMEKLSANTARYLQLQQEAGIDAFQLFDTWAGVLRPADFQRLVLPYVRRIFAEVELPSIYYVKNSAHVLPLMEKSGADFLSVCETVEIGANSVLNATRKGVQGNLFNGLLYKDDATIIQETRRLLSAARRHHTKYIFNLSHGMMPDMAVEKVHLLVREVQKFTWQKQLRS